MKVDKPTPTPTPAPTPTHTHTHKYLVLKEGTHESGRGMNSRFVWHLSWDRHLEQFLKSQHSLPNLLREITIVLVCASNSKISRIIDTFHPKITTSPHNHWSPRPNTPTHPLAHPASQPPTHPHSREIFSNVSIIVVLRFKKKSHTHTQITTSTHTPTHTQFRLFHGWQNFPQHFSNFLNVKQLQRLRSSPPPHQRNVLKSQHHCRFTFQKKSQNSAL